MKVIDFHVLQETEDCVIAEVTLRSLFRTTLRQVFAPRNLVFYKWRYLDNGGYAPDAIEQHFIAWQAKRGIQVSQRLVEREKAAAAAFLGCYPLV